MNCQEEIQSHLAFLIFMSFAKMSEGKGIAHNHSTLINPCESFCSMKFLGQIEPDSHFPNGLNCVPPKAMC